ncbi:MAG: long-chain fatty acid--CoA ligase [Chloroflexi bacterium]|nr:long-chain fatty acid--CoA ligase [Chloroflexota bacterium]MBV9895573.1 long-chain fatty acid--CoA ligase [Chloroflexota bacterium]
MLGTMMDFPLTLQHVFDRGTRLFPDREIVTGGLGERHRYTYKDFARRVHRLASAFKALGLQPGERVGTFGWNHYRHLEMYFAVPMQGAVLHTLNIRLFHDQLVYIINHAADRFIVVDRSLLGIVQALQPMLETVEKIIVVDDGGDCEVGDALDYEQFLASGNEHFDFPRLDENTAAMMCYTSGTTGNPKGVAYSHRALTLHSFGACLSDSVGVSQRDTVLAVVPMFHANAWGLPYAATMVGAKQVFAGNSMAPDRVLQLMQDERVTLGAGVPTIWIGALPLLQAGKYDLSSVTRIACGGSAAPRGLIDAYDKLGLNIVHAWGMTELTPIGSVAVPLTELDSADPATQMDFKARQGTPVPGVEARALDSDGKEVPWDGQTMGELVVRGPWVAASYYNDDRSAGSFTSDGWFRTGDIVVMHPNGYIEIADRTKDVIKSGGEWISSVALENALMAHPKVQEAAVIGVPDEKWSERPLACVVPRPDFKGSVKAEELSEFLAQQFAKWWLPERYLFLDELPKTSVGKFDKKTMRVQYTDSTKAVTA